jgi:hypothetical protein
MAPRGLPSWLTAPASVTANVGALTIAAQALGNAHYRVAGVHVDWVVYLYWLGAVPAIAVLGRLIARGT